MFVIKPFGYGDWARDNNVTTAVSADKRVLVSYLPGIQPLMIDFGYLNEATFTGYWFNPSNGEKSSEFTVASKTVQRIAPINGSDWVLVIQAN